ncbi:lipoprotein LpqH [Mycobacterium sp.]|jgi:lipoprotein LpqH|uniref:lipoprotein LpqH n=1 Tax=Mycobacterium sp. TaxID=1785 RepID=UPI003F9DB55C
MKREVMITVGAAATLAGVLAGCSHHDGAVSAGNAAVAPASASNTKVLIDGKDQNVKGQVACTTAAGNVNIAIGGSGSTGVPTGIGAVLTDASPPVVTSVALGNVNGVSLGVGGTTGKAQATKDGNAYKITGTASGVDMSNPMAGPVNKPFELDVTCP